MNYTLLIHELLNANCVSPFVCLGGKITPGTFEVRISECIWHPNRNHTRIKLSFCKHPQKVPLINCITHSNNKIINNFHQIKFERKWKKSNPTRKSLLCNVKTLYSNTMDSYVTIRISIKINENKKNLEFTLKNCLRCIKNLDTMV